MGNRKAVGRGRRPAGHLFPARRDVPAALGEGAGADLRGMEDGVARGEVLIIPRSHPASTPLMLARAVPVADADCITRVSLKGGTRRPFIRARQFGRRCAVPKAKFKGV